MFKEGGSIKTWKKRWFFFDGTKLSYCTKSTTKNKPSGTIKRSDIQDVDYCSSKTGPGKYRQFGIKLTTSYREYVFLANTLDDQASWVEAIGEWLEEYESGEDSESEVGKESKSSSSSKAQHNRDEEDEEVESEHSQDGEAWHTEPNSLSSLPIRDAEKERRSVPLVKASMSARSSNSPVRDEVAKPVPRPMSMSLQMEKQVSEESLSAFTERLQNLSMDEHVPSAVEESSGGAPKSHNSVASEDEMAGGALNSITTEVDEAMVSPPASAGMASPISSLQAPEGANAVGDSSSHSTADEVPPHTVNEDEEFDEEDSDSGENDLAIAGALGFASMLEEGSGSREGSEIGASPQQQTKPQAPSKPPPSRPPGVTELVFPGLNRIRASGTSASSATGSGSSTPSKKAVSEASTSVLDSSGSSSVSQKKVHRALADSKDFAAICSRESALKNLKLEENGELLLTDVVEKINQRNTKQNRVMCITEKTVFFLAPNNYVVQHQFPLQNLCGIFLCDDKAQQFAFRVWDDHDFLIASRHQEEIVRTLQSAAELLQEKPVPVTVMWDILKVIDRVNSLPAFEEGILPMESTSEDHLHCSRLPDLVQTFISNGDRRVLFSHLVVKYNHRRHGQRRAFVVTDAHLYVFHPIKRAEKRMIDMDEIATILESTSDQEQFAFCVESGYDVWLASPFRKSIISIVQQVYLQSHPYNQLFLQTCNDMQKRVKNRKNKQAIMKSKDRKAQSDSPAAVMDLLTRAIATKNMNQLEQAVQKARAISLTDPQVQQAAELHKRLTEEFTIRQKLQEGLEQEDVSVVMLQLRKAQDLGIDDVFQEERKEYNKLRTRLDLRSRIHEALEAEDVEKLKELSDEADSQEMESESLQARSFIDRHNKISTTKSVLKEAVAMRDAAALRRALQQARALGFTDSELAASESALEGMREEEELRRGIRAALFSEDADALEKAIDAASSCEPLREDVEKARKEFVERREIRQLRLKLEEAVSVKSYQGILETVSLVAKHPMAVTLQSEVEQATSMLQELRDAELRRRVAESLEITERTDRALASRDVEALRGLIERAHALQQLAGLSRPTHSSESVEDEEEKEGEAVESDRGEAPLLGFGDSQREKLFLDTLRRAENVMSSVAEGARMRTQLLEAIERRDAEVLRVVLEKMADQGYKEEFPADVKLGLEVYENLRLQQGAEDTLQELILSFQEAMENTEEEVELENQEFEDMAKCISSAEKFPDLSGLVQDAKSLLQQAMCRKELEHEMQKALLSQDLSHIESLSAAHCGVLSTRLMDIADEAIAFLRKQLKFKERVEIAIAKGDVNELREILSDDEACKDLPRAVYHQACKVWKEKSLSPSDRRHSMVSQEIFEKVQTEIEAGSPEGSGENDALPEHSEENHAGDRDAVTERATIVADVSLPNSSGPTRVGMSKSPPPIKVEDSEEREEEPGEHVDVSTTTTGEALTLEEVFVKEEDLGGIVDGAFISVYTPEDLEPILEAAKDPSNAKTLKCGDRLSLCPGIVVVFTKDRLFRLDPTGVTSIGPCSQRLKDKIHTLQKSLEEAVATGQTELADGCRDELTRLDTEMRKVQLAGGIQLGFRYSNWELRGVSSTHTTESTLSEAVTPSGRARSLSSILRSTSQSSILEPSADNGASSSVVSRKSHRLIQSILDCVELLRREVEEHREEVPAGIVRHAASKDKHGRLIVQPSSEAALRLVKTIHTLLTSNLQPGYSAQEAPLLVLSQIRSPQFDASFLDFYQFSNIKKLPEDKLNKLGLLLFIQYLLNHRILWDRLSEALEVPGFLETTYTPSAFLQKAENIEELEAALNLLNQFTFRFKLGSRSTPSPERRASINMGGSFPYPPNSPPGLLRAASVAITQHFVQTGKAKDLKLLGDDSITPRIVELVRGDLCSALAAFLSMGFKTKKLFSKNHLWDLFTFVASKDKGLQFSRDVMGVQSLVDDSWRKGDKDVKLRTLVCLALSQQSLLQYLLLVISNGKVLDKYYEEDSIMWSPAASEILNVTLGKLDKLPFKLTLDLELR